MNVYGSRIIYVGSICSYSLVVACMHTFVVLIQCEGVTTMLNTALEARRWASTVCA